jgi:hypothetical protein
MKKNKQNINNAIWFDMLSDHIIKHWHSLTGNKELTSLTLADMVDFNKFYQRYSEYCYSEDVGNKTSKENFAEDEYNKFMIFNVLSNYIVKFIKPKYYEKVLIKLDSPRHASEIIIGKLPPNNMIHKEITTIEVSKFKLPNDTTDIFVSNGDNNDDVRTLIIICIKALVDNTNDVKNIYQYLIVLQVAMTERMHRLKNDIGKKQGGIKAAEKRILKANIWRKHLITYCANLTDASTTRRIERYIKAHYAKWWQLYKNGEDTAVIPPSFITWFKKVKSQGLSRQFDFYFSKNGKTVKENKFFNYANQIINKSS